MSTNRVRWYVLLGSALGILCCTFGCMHYINTVNEYQKRYPYEQSPIRTLSIQIGEGQREELFTQLRKFSEKHHLEFSLSLYTNEKSNDTFFIVMYGETLRISALSKPIHTTELDISFFEEDPTNPPSQEVVEELFGDLKEFISEIPNITITEER